MPKENLKVSDFDYHLPKELIAQYPCAKREDSRLLVLERVKKKITHKRFTDIVNYFSSGDCLVLNNTKVIPARMLGHRQTHPHPVGGGGGKQEIFLLENLSENIYRVLARPAKKLTVGRKIFFNNATVVAVVLADEGMRKVVKFSTNADIADFWQALGQIPLPPYIKREPQDSDNQRYQTVYAQSEGATAAPTAGLHFTREILEAIRAKGVSLAYLTLHINYGTFAAVKLEDIERHKMHKEYFILTEKAEELINAARSRGKRVFAAGTTSARVLETCARGNSRTRALPKATRGWTDLFIYPPYRFKVVDCLLTNFHFPKSTLLMLASAFAGKEFLFEAYAEAIKRRYRFFSYGDAMLIV